MEKHCHLIVFSLVVFFAISFYKYGIMVNGMRTKDGFEQWEYVEVRENAHMLWWFYRSPKRENYDIHSWPLILGCRVALSGSSGNGMGNFQEIGPKDEDSNSRHSTWLDIADILFVDCPIGTGFSYANDTQMMGRGDEVAVSDLTALLIKFSESCESLERRPLFIVGESYGGRYAVGLGISLLDAIKKGKLNATLAGIVLAGAWISPLDYTNSWGPILKYASRLDEIGLNRTKRVAKLIKQQVEKELFENATASFLVLQQVIYNNTNGGDLYNLLLDGLEDSSTGDDVHFTKFMNHEIRKKLQIIPSNVQWVKNSNLVFNLSRGDFMRPRIDEVDLLLEKEINVTIYNGQWDVLCSPKGTEAWMKKLKWKWIDNFWSTERTPIYYGNDSITTMGFTKSYKNLLYAVVFGAGHHVPMERPFVTQNLIREVTHSPAS